GDIWVEYPASSPDKTKIAFMSQESNAAGNSPNYNIYLMNPDGSGIARLTDYSGEDGFPAWSPDGKKIAFSSTRDNETIAGNLAPLPDIWLMNANGSDLTRLTHNGGDYPAWSPDGKYIIFGAVDGLAMITPDGSNLTPLPIQGVSQPLFQNW